MPRARRMIATLLRVLLRCSATTRSGMVPSTESWSRVRRFLQPLQSASIRLPARVAGAPWTGSLAVTDHSDGW